MHPTKLKINLIFLSGSFVVNKGNIPKRKRSGKVVKLVGGNKLKIYFAQKHKYFNFILTKNIRHYLTRGLFSTVIKNNIDEELQGDGEVDMRKVSTKIGNYHMSKTFNDLKPREFIYQLLFPFCKRFLIEEVSIPQEAGTPGVKTKLSHFRKSVEENHVGIPNTIQVIRLRKSQRNKTSVVIKFQINTLRAKVHVTAIVTDFFQETKAILNWLDKPPICILKKKAK